MGGCFVYDDRNAALGQRDRSGHAGVAAAEYGDVYRLGAHAFR
jgi:hypothetical protein